LISTRGHGESWNPADAWLLLLYGLAAPFFVAYSSVFTRRRHENAPWARDSFVTVSLGGILFAVIGLFGYRISTNVWPTVVLLVSVVSISLVLLVYGLYLLWIYDVASPRVRHQLVWPILLAVGISLYVGLSLPTFHNSYHALVAPGLLFLLILTSDRIKKRLPLIVYVAAFATFAALALWSQGYRNDLLTMFFCVCVAAYLAVFEAWGATSLVGREQNTKVLNQETLIGRYYKATLITLIASGLAFPGFYIYTQFTQWFLLAFGIHTIIAFSLWFGAGRDNQFRDWRWFLLKTIWGATALGVLIVDAFARDHGVSSSDTLMNGPTVSLAAGITLFMLGLEIKARNDERQLPGPTAAHTRRRGYIVSVLLIAMFCTYATYEVYLSNVSSDQMIAARARYACWLYLSYWLAAILFLVRRYYDLFMKGPNRNTNVIGMVIGVLVLVRAFTATIVAAVVAVPLVLAGRHWTVAILDAGPFYLAAMGGFALNDIFDVQSDAVNRPYRPLPNKTFGVTPARAIAVSMLLSAIVLSAFAAHSYVQLMLYTAAIVGVVAYNFVVRRWACCKGLYTSFICGLPLIYLLQEHLGTVWFLIGAIVYIWGRETLMDIFDIKGDRVSGRITIPMMIGPNVAANCAFSLLFLSVLAIAMAGIPFRVLVMLCSWLLLLTILWHCYGTSGRRWTVYLLWIPMLVVPLGSLSNLFLR
jgi:4-hydroxybenzoate polyprenyltransferase